MPHHIRNLRHQRIQRQRKATPSHRKQNTQYHLHLHRIALYDPHQRARWTQKRKSRKGRPAGAVAIAEPADKGPSEGRDGEGQEDEAAADGVPGESLVGVDREDGFEAGEDGALDEGAPEGGQEAAGGEEGYDGGEVACLVGSRVVEGREGGGEGGAGAGAGGCTGRFGRDAVGRVEVRWLGL